MNGPSKRTRAILIAGVTALILVGTGLFIARRRTAPAHPEQRLLESIRRHKKDPAHRVALARYYLAGGRFNNSLDVCREAAGAFPDSVEVKDVLSQSLIATGRFVEAASVLEPLEGVNPAYPLRRAAALIRSGDLSGAERILANRRLSDSLTADQRVQMGQLHLDLANFEAAALLLTPPAGEAAAPEAGISLGYALLAAGSYRGAISALERVVTAAPDEAAAQFYLGSAIRLSGDRKKLPDAEAALARAVTAEPNDAEVQYELGLARVQLRQWEPAREALEAAARLKPDLPEAQRDLSRVRERTGDRLGAAIAQSRYLRLIGDAAGAVRLLEPLAATGNLDLTLELCEAYYDNLQTPLTLKYLRRLNERNPKDLRVLQARFRGERAADHKGEALRLLTQAQALLPADDHSLDADRTGLLRDTGKYDELERALRQAIAENPKSAAALYELGAALARWPTGQNRDVEAEQVLRQVVDLDTTHAQARYDLAMILARTNRAPEAIIHLRAALDQVPLMKDALRVLGQAYATTGDKKRSQDAYALYRQVEAREEEQKRLELPSSLYKATAQDRLQLARFYIRAANRPAAVTELEALLHKHPENMEARRMVIGLYGQLRRFQRQFEERRLLKTGTH